MFTLIFTFLANIAFVGLLIVGYPIIQHVSLVGGGFTSKSVCSGVFVSGRSLHSIVDNELAGISATLFVPVIDYQEQTVTTSLLGMSASLADMLGLSIPVAAYLGPKFGCQLQIDPATTKSIRGFDFMGARSDPLFASEAQNSVDLPFSYQKDSSEKGHKEEKESSEIRHCIEELIHWQFTEDASRVNQTRATVVLHHGHVVAEGYQTEYLNITAKSRLLGWSMTKSVFALVVGAAIHQGYLELDTPLLLSQISPGHRATLIEMNRGREITFRHLLNMDDVLFVEEDYDLLKFIVQALFGSYDISGFVLSNEGSKEGFTTYSHQGKDHFGVRGSPSKPLGEAHPDSDAEFAWYYSSAVSNVLSRELRDRIGNDPVYWELPHKALFDPIGASSFVLELDPSGTFVASSFSYGTARDWAKLGQLLLNDGMWQSADGSMIRVLPSQFVSFLQQAHPASGGHYGGHVWLNPARVGVSEYNRISSTHKSKRQNAWMTTALPADAFFFSGFEGQNVFIIPSMDVVISRLGFTLAAAAGSEDPRQTSELKGWDHAVYYGGIVKCFEKIHK